MKKGGKKQLCLLDRSLEKDNQPAVPTESQNQAKNAGLAELEEE